jgi:hypothetical protein
MKVLFILLTTIFISSCSVFCQVRDTVKHDIQLIQIYYRSGPDILNTFNETYQKDLIPGTVTTVMWLTTREQEILLTKIESAKFFSFPDTLYSTPNVMVTPGCGWIIRMKYKQLDKTVVVQCPIDESKYGKYENDIYGIQSLLNDIIVSKPEYKALPERKGGYQ